MGGKSRAPAEIKAVNLMDSGSEILSGNLSDSHDIKYGPVQAYLYEPNAAILALIISSPVVPLIDAVSRGRIYRWEQPAAPAAGQFKGV